jgi:hypothetical protein
MVYVREKKKVSGFVYFIKNGSIRSGHLVYLFFKKKWGMGEEGYNSI